MLDGGAGLGRPPPKGGGVATIGLRRVRFSKGSERLEAG